MKNFFKFCLFLIFINAGFNFYGVDRRELPKIALWSDRAILRGVNVYQRRVYPELDDGFLGEGIIGPEYTLDDFLRLRKLGVNYVNLSCPGIFTEKPPYTLDEEVLNYIERLIKLIEKADMFVVISFRTGPGRSEFTFFRGEDYESDPKNGWFDKSYYNDEVWESREAQDGWVKMWAYTAEYFRGNPSVVGYDLMVEPNSNDVCCDIWDPDEFYSLYKGTTYDWNSFFPEIVRAIRERDPEIPIIVEPLSYADINWLEYVKIVKNSNVIYSVHQYEPYQYTHQSPDAKKGYPGFYDIDYDGVAENFNKKWLTKYLKVLKEFKFKKGVLVAVNEFGGVRWAPSIENFIDDEISFFEEIGANHAVWMWYPGVWLKPPFSFIFSAFNFLFGPDPENFIETENAYKETLLKYWRRNEYFPSNVKIIISKKRERKEKIFKR